MRKPSRNNVGGRVLRMERCEERRVLSAAQPDLELPGVSINVEFAVERPLADSAFLSGVGSSGVGSLGLTPIDPTTSLSTFGSLNTAGAFVDAQNSWSLTTPGAVTDALRDQRYTIEDQPVASTPSAGQEAAAQFRIVAIGRFAEDAAVPGIDRPDGLGTLGLIGDALSSRNDVKPQLVLFEDVDVDAGELIVSGDTVVSDLVVSEAHAPEPVAPPPTAPEITEPTPQVAATESDFQAEPPSTVVGPVASVPEPSAGAADPIVTVSAADAYSLYVTPQVAYGPYVIDQDDATADLVIADEGQPRSESETPPIEDFTAELEFTDEEASQATDTTLPESVANAAVQRVTVPTPPAGAHAPGAGAIDLAALLIEETPRIYVVRAEAVEGAAEELAAADVAARDVALAMESWTRTVRPLDPAQALQRHAAAPALAVSGALPFEKPLELAERGDAKSAAGEASDRDAGTPTSRVTGSSWTSAISTLLGGALIWMSRREGAIQRSPRLERLRHSDPASR